MIYWVQKYSLSGSPGAIVELENSREFYELSMFGELVMVAHTWENAFSEAQAQSYKKEVQKRQ